MSLVKFMLFFPPPSKFAMEKIIRNYNTDQIRGKIVGFINSWTSIWGILYTDKLPLCPPLSTHTQFNPTQVKVSLVRNTSGKLRLGMISKDSYSLPFYPLPLKLSLSLHLPNQWQKQGLGIEADMEVQSPHCSGFDSREYKRALCMNTKVPGGT